MSYSSRRGLFGRPAVGREQGIGPAVLTAQSAPTDVLEGAQTVEPFPMVRWFVVQPSDIPSYDVQLYRWSVLREAWVPDGDPYTGLTTSRTFEQSSGAPLYCRIYGFGATSATGFTKAIQGFNSATT